MKLEEYTSRLNPVRIERIMSLVGGGALVSYGILRRSRASLPLAFLGGGLVYHAVHRAQPESATEGMGEKGLRTSLVIPRGHGICVEELVMINRPPEELYRWWRNLENVPRVFGYLDSVQVLDDRRSHWIAKAPGETRVEWDAEIINDIPNRLIGWRSLQGADVPNAGSVHFDPAPGGRGTRLKVELEYDPPAGALAAAFAKLFGREPTQTIYKDLISLKQLMETGEMVATEG